MHGDIWLQPTPMVEFLFWGSVGLDSESVPSFTESYTVKKRKTVWGTPISQAPRETEREREIGKARKSELTS